MDLSHTGTDLLHIAVDKLSLNVPTLIPASIFHRETNALKCTVRLRGCRVRVLRSQSSPPTVCGCDDR